jgi:DNA-binding transcriptional ArsR family regulator
MAATERTESPQVQLLKTLAHPTRLKIVGALSSRDISPAEYARENREDVSNVAYHFRLLKKMGCAEVVDTKPARGSTEHFHRRTRPIIFDDDIWPTLPSAMHVAVSHTILEDLLCRIREAFVAGTFDAQTDRHFTWTPMVVDQEGWKRLTSILLWTFEQFTAINEESAERMAETGEAGMEVTAALIGFESPKRQPNAK